MSKEYKFQLVKISTMNNGVIIADGNNKVTIPWNEIRKIGFSSHDIILKSHRLNILMNDGGKKTFIKGLSGSKSLLQARRALSDNLKRYKKGKDIIDIDIEESIRMILE